MREGNEDRYNPTEVFLQVEVQKYWYHSSSKGGTIEEIFAWFARIAGQVLLLG